ncbi:hypothetical protein ACIRBX_07725 [Kitasatospora sp. NPDC096147]|uniref:hypothetical protein n=1 Tax=Kitasatospora sp. NPDC096147 TaxID=3364093 RepID=UPI003829ABE9
MRVVIVWWDLADSKAGLDELRAFLREEAVERFTGHPGLVRKTWISDRAANRWGAVFLWESAEAADRPILPPRAVELIGYPPTHRAAFDVEATVEGAAHLLAALPGLGLAHDPES